MINRRGEWLDLYGLVLKRYRENPALRSALIARLANDSPGMTPADIQSQISYDAESLKTAVSILENAKTVLFSATQAGVLRDSRGSFSDALDFRLPFPSVLIQFSEPIEFHSHMGNSIQADRLVAIALTQIEQTKGVFESLALDWYGGFPVAPGDSKNEFLERVRDRVDRVSSAAYENTDVAIFNRALAIYADHGTTLTNWSNTGYDEAVLWDVEADKDKALQGIVQSEIKHLAISCIGFINCENVHLHTESVPDKVNRKRAARGKRILEPYYVCRIDGVKYNSDGSEAGTGSQHGFRYDVRGHFRRLENKTIWVRPHQRGLAHDLYIPKTYDARGKRAPA